MPLESFKRQGRSWPVVLGNRRIGDNDIDAVDTMHFLQVVNGIGGIFGRFAIQFQDDQMAVLCCRELAQRQAGGVAGVADTGDDNRVCA
jgi:hypothetical protein